MSVEYPTPFSSRLGPLLAGAAILVQGPRLVLTTLAADRLAVDSEAETVLLSIAALGTAIVLTGGGIYIAHAALTAARWRLALGFAWLLVLTASAALVAPGVAGRLADQELHEVLSDPSRRKAWAVLATLAHELTAAGCMLAAAAGSRRQSTEDLELRLYAERDAAIERAELAERRLSQSSSGLSGAASELPSAEATLTCSDCGRSFLSKQARAGHQRSCPSRPSAQQQIAPREP